MLFSGGFFELFLWGVAVVAWRVVAPETWTSRVLFVVVGVCGVRALFNFNPLIKMDGYFLLSDYLGIANLRREALGGIGRFTRRLLGLDSAPISLELRDRRILAMRGDRFLTLFGAAALLYTAILVGYIAFYSGDWVFQELGSTALGLYSVFLVGLLHKPAVTAASEAKEVSKEKWEQLGQQKRRFRFVFLWAALLLLIAFFPWTLRIPSDLQILPMERETVRAPAEGRIAESYFAEGDQVQKGELILKYDTTERELERKTKIAELEQARRELSLLAKRNPVYLEETQVKERELETSRAEEQAARQDFDRAQQLWTEGLISKDGFDREQNDLEQAQSRRRKAEADLALVRKQSRDSRNEQMEVLHLRDPDAQEAVIERLEAELDKLEDLLSRSKVYASISGTLTTYRFQEKVGEFLEEGTVVCEIVNDERVVVEMPVAEKDIDVIALGHPVQFKVRGYPSRRFHAEVAEIAPIATPNGATSSILVRATVDNSKRLLKPGMTGVAKIYCGTSFVGKVLTRDFVRFVRTEFWF